MQMEHAFKAKKVAIRVKIKVSIQKSVDFLILTYVFLVRDEKSFFMQTRRIHLGSPTFSDQIRGTSVLDVRVFRRIQMEHAFKAKK